jgi:hypothetical protein
VPGATQCLLEAPMRDRLQKIVERVHLERAQRVPVVGGNEHDRREVCRGDARDDIEPVEPWHLHVEEHEVRAQRENRVHRRLAIAGLADDLDVLFPPEADAQPFARKRLVVDEHGTDHARHARLSIAART